jgi:hypothetical protein
MDPRELHLPDGRNGPFQVLPQGLSGGASEQEVPSFLALDAGNRLRCRPEDLDPGLDPGQGLPDALGGLYDALERGPPELDLDQVPVRGVPQLPPFG